MLIAIVSIRLRILHLIAQSREELIRENLALRRQLVVLKSEIRGLIGRMAKENPSWGAPGVVRSGRVGM